MRGGEAGQVGGGEALAFGVLLFVLGTLGLVSSWSVLDHKVAVGSAAREAARAYVESADGAWGPAEARGRAAYAGHGRDPAHLRLSLAAGTFQRCERVTVTAWATVELPRVPILRPLASRSAVSAQHTEVVDPYRSGLAGRGANPCG